MQLARLKALAESSGLDVTFMEEVMRKIIDEVVRRHEKLKAKRCSKLTFFKSQHTVGDIEHSAQAIHMPEVLMVAYPDIP